MILKKKEIRENEKIKYKCPECKGQVIQRRFEKVCKECGLVISDLKFEKSYQFNETRDSEFKSSDQFVSIGKTVDSVTTLGSNIGYFKSNVFYDYRRRLIDFRKQKLFRKLKKYYFLPSKIKNQETDYRILKVLDKIVNHLDLSQQVKNRAAYFYRRIKKNAEKITNHVSLIAFCIFYSSREFSHNAPINIHELCSIFKEFGHRINPRLIIRDNIQYSKIIKNKNKPHKSEDYLFRLIDKIINWPDLPKRMKKKDSNWSLEEYRMKLVKFSKFILGKMDKRVRGSRNPFIMAATTIYCADRIISFKFKTKKILTQKIASEAMDIPEYSIRDHFVKIFKPYFGL